MQQEDSEDERREAEKGKNGEGGAPSKRKAWIVT